MDERRIIEGQTINLDRESYRDTDFRSCTILFSGTRSDIDGCTFADCMVDPLGNAATAVTILRKLNEAPGGRAIIERLFPAQR